MRHILHADLDAFYASVEQRDNPGLRGRPVLVGGSPESRGVVAAASYEARRFGVRSAMPMRTAVWRCPEAVVVAPRFERYREVSRRVMGIFHRITPLVEPLSLDEAYLDVSAIVSPARPPEAIASALKRQVKEEVGLTVSVGVATSKSVAKIASELAKPDGLTVVPPGAEREFLASLPVDRLWGIGPKTARRLQEQGVHHIGQLAERPEGWFAQQFGKRGLEVLQMAIGRDDRPVVTERAAKSLSAETTLPHDVSDREHVTALVDSLSQRVARRLEEHGLQGRTVTLKLRLADFTTFTRQATLPFPTRDGDTIAEGARRLLERELHPGRWYRLVGVGVSNFEESGQTPQLALFGPE